MGMIWWHSCLSFFCYNAFLSKIVFSDFGRFPQLRAFKKPSLGVNEGLALKSYGIFSWACSQWGGLASIIRHAGTFLFTNANSLHWQQAQQKSSQIIGMHSMQTQWRSFNAHSCRNLSKSEINFGKECIITGKIKHSQLYRYATKSWFLCYVEPTFECH